MVVVVSVVAAFTLFFVFFVSVFAFGRVGVPRTVGALGSALMAGIAWFVVVAVGRNRGLVRTDEAQFHHLYVLAVVGLPLVGVAIAMVTWLRPAPSPGARALGWTTAALFMLPALAGVWATHVEPHWLRVDRVSIYQSGANGLAPPIRVGVIADIQTDRFGAYELRAIQRMVEEEPDVILVAGDITQVEWEDYLAIRADGVDALAMLEAPYGVFVIQGNTDPSSAEVLAFSLDAGLTPLLDEQIEVEVYGRTLRIAGLAWPNNRRLAAAELVRSFAETSTDDAIDLLLAHSPDAIFNLPTNSKVDLVVSGHTHGGQISLPFVGPLWNVTELPDDVAAGGLHKLRGVPTYVSTGVGVQRGESPKVRFGVRPSIGVITIR